MSELKDLDGMEKQDRALEWLEEAEKQYEEDREAAIAAALIGLSFLFWKSYAYVGEI